jgi:competence ComEA-like helix-hairpin-helix protein
MEAPARAVALDTITTPTGVTRDPQQPFSVMSLQIAGVDAVTTSSGLNPTAHRLPTQPFSVSSSLANQSLNWEPPNEAPLMPTAAPIAARDLLTAAYPPLLWLMLIAGAIALVWPAGGFFALLACLTFQASRVRFKQKSLIWLIITALVVIAVVWLIDWAVNQTTSNVDLGLGWWAAVACWAVAVADLLLQRSAMRNPLPSNQPMATAAPARTITSPTGPVNRQPVAAVSPSAMTRLNLNQASFKQLNALPGIGPAMAGAIIAWRGRSGPFTDVRQLLDVDGIGPKTFAVIAPLVAV